MSTKSGRSSRAKAAEARIESGVLEADALQSLLDTLHARGYTVLGPTEQHGAVAYAPIERVDELPRDLVDEQEAGAYRLGRRDRSGYFAHVVGAHSWKKFLFPPSRTLWKAERTGRNGTFEVRVEDVPAEKFAFLGVRACDIAAIAVQDRIFIHGPYPDPLYAERRKNALIVAANCSRSAATCFCSSMETGPNVTSGFDLLLTELIDADRHEFLVEAGSTSGRSILEALPVRAATDEDARRAEEVIEQAQASIRRSLETADVHDLLLSNLDHQRWTQVAERCLACGNCTLVCPTCFCMTVEDVTDLTGQSSERHQKWDSCFTLEHSYIHGGSVRTSIRSRYRQWLTHKVATWIDQFGVSGCVGCGRCIAWCPVGIDLTEEIRAIRETTAHGAKAR